MPQSSTPSPSSNVNFEESEFDLEQDELALKGTKMLWKSVKTGMSVVIARRDLSGRSDWCNEMDKTVGEVGFIKAFDEEKHQVLIAFYDNFTTYQEWWYSVDCMIENKQQQQQSQLDAFQQFIKLSFNGTEEELHDIVHATHKDLSIITSRQAVFALLLNSIPVSLNSIATFGNTRNLISVLKLIVQETNSHLLRGQPLPTTSLISKLGLSTRLLTTGVLFENLQRNEMLPKKSDYLDHKHGKLLKGWTRHWITLQGHYLSYHKKSSSTTPLGKIERREIIFVKKV